MSFLFDDLTRTLASPMPRRRMLKSIGGILSGAFLTSVAVIPARAQTTCQNCDKNGKCPGNQTCTSIGNKCCPKGNFACGNQCCSSASCCNTGAGKCFTSNKCTGCI